MRNLALALLLLSLRLAAAVPWLDPSVNRIGALPSRADYFAFETPELALAGDKTQSQRFISLHGLWRFHFTKDHNQAPPRFFSPTFDDSAWELFPVPGMLELNGHGDPTYRNKGYAWSTQHESRPPIVEERNNYTGSYRRFVRIPETWTEGDVYLHIGSATSNVRLWVNGSEVGYAEDSKLASEFCLTPYVRPGADNLICMQVMRWCDGSYAEDQDFWRFTGIARESYLMLRPRYAYLDVNVSTSWHEDKAILSVTHTEPLRSDTITYSLISPDGQTIWQSNERPEGVRLPGLKPWTPENPQLYTLLRSRSIGEHIALRVGFRTVSIEGGQLLLNGRPLLIKGVNRHEMDPDGGYVVSPERMLDDIRQLKLMNINAVRTCHYPADPRWLDLCDQYGIMVVSEANFEGHGMGYGATSLARNPDYLQTLLERNRSNVAVNRNHPCVVVWSLGNESGYGPNFDEAYRMVKELDPSRPVQYEMAGSYELAKTAGSTDVLCPMYYTYADCERYLTSGQCQKPLIQCEYAHAMGNSLGGYKENWDLIRRYPHYQGGFMWDFADQGLRAVSKATGKQIWAYGGDYGRYAASDHSGNNNGILAPDRTWHPQAHEVAHQHQNIWTTYAGGDTLAVSSEQFYEPLSSLTIRAEVKVEGRSAGVLCVPCPAVGPQCTEAVGVSGLSDLISSAMASPGEVTLDVDFCLPRDPQGLLPDGHAVATEQFVVRERERQTPRLALSSAELKAVRADSMLACYTLAANGVSITVGRRSGMLDFLDVDGRSALAEGFSVTPNFWRAPTDNDYGARFQTRFRAWQSPEMSEPEVTLRGNQITSRWRLTRLEAYLTQEFTLLPDGTLHVRQSLRTDTATQGKPNLMRFGMQWVMPGGEADSVRFYGRGPWETYVDRRSAARLGLYEQAVSEQYHADYVRPCESGNHTDVQWFELGGLRFEAADDLQFSALPFLPADLDNGPSQRERQSHSGDLVPRGQTVVQVQSHQMGLGCVTSWGAWPRDEYLLPYADYELTYTIKPIRR